MILRLDYETVSALESALIVAEVTRARDAKAWRKVAESQGAYSQGASEHSREAGELAAFFRRQANRYRTAMDALQKAQREAHIPDSKFPSDCEFAQKERPSVLRTPSGPKKKVDPPLL